MARKKLSDMTPMERVDRTMRCIVGGCRERWH